MTRTLNGIGRKTLVAVLCAGVVAFCSCSKGKKEVPEKAAAPRTESTSNAYIERAVVLPDVVLKNVDGTTGRTADYRGQLVILVFWAPWNKDCVSQIPAMNAVYEKFKNHRITLLGVVVGKENRAGLKAFIAEKKITFPVFYNGDDVAAAMGGVRKLPANYVILRDGTVFDKELGVRPYTYFEEVIRTILSKRM